MSEAIDLSRLRHAIESLKRALEPPPANDRERDGAIQRFEYTFELAWKSAARVLAAEGISARSPRSVLRELGVQGWVDDVEAWFAFLEMRNETAYIYKEEIAEAVFARLGDFKSAVDALSTTLQRVVDRG